MKFQSLNPKYCYKLFVEIIKFLIQPTPDKQKELENRERIRNTIILFLISLFIGGVVNLFLHLILRIDTNHIGMSKAKELYNPSILLFIGGVLFPLLEEIGFRLLLKFKPIYLSLSISVLVYYIATKLIYHTYNTDLENNFESIAS